jgi:purine-binding chemotaxis protein CheW
VSNQLSTLKSKSEMDYLATLEQFLRVRSGGQLFGIPVVRVRDVLKPQRITKIPLASPEIVGFMNLRGRIVTVVDLSKRLRMESVEEEGKKMFVVVESEDDLYCLQVDSVGDTQTLPIADFEKNPENMEQSWKDLSRGVFKLDKELMLVLDISNLLNF